MQRFEVAPWSTPLRVVSTVGTVVLAGVSYALFRAIPRGTRVPFAEAFGTLVLFIPALILAIAVLFVVTGYELDGSGLHVQRLLWSTRVGLDGLDRAWHDPSAMRRSLRIFGNGGLFAISGLFQNATLGRYRAFVTDPGRAVVLHLPSRVVVVSPAHPRAFLGQIRLLFPAAAVAEPAE